MRYGICQIPNNPVQAQHSAVLLGSSPLDGMQVQAEPGLEIRIAREQIGYPR
jgi:hypothetical protein